MRTYENIIYFAEGRINKKVRENDNVMVTLKDVADVCGVSDATVSRVLSGAERVNSEVSARVMEVVAELGYVYRKRGRAKRSVDKKILIVADNVANPVYMEIIQSALKMLESQGYKVLIIQSSSATSLEEIIRFAKYDQFSGVMLITAVETQELIELLKNASFRMVLVNRFIRSLDLNSVCLDNATGGYRATQYLIDKGHTKIAHLSGPMNSTASFDRYRGYTMALQDGGLTTEKKAVYQGNLTKDSGKEFADYFIKQLGEYTAVFCANDLMAVGFLDEVKNRGYKVPEDISVIGFDDIPLAESYNLTSFLSDGNKMGIVAAEIMANIQSNDEYVIRKVVFPPTLQERGSVLDINAINSKE